MSKQEEIREGIAQKIMGLGRNPDKWSYEFADELLIELAEQGGDLTGCVIVRVESLI